MKKKAPPHSIQETDFSLGNERRSETVKVPSQKEFFFGGIGVRMVAFIIH